MQRRIYDVCIIGAGASGLIAAIESSRRGLSCVVIDKNKKPGMKLYVAGATSQMTPGRRTVITKMNS